MNYSIKKLAGGVAEISFVVLPEDYANALERAAQLLTTEKPLEGFRPGKAPYDVIKQRFGEAKILETAFPSIVQKFYASAIKKEGLETVGEPGVSVSKMVPGETLEYKLAVALLPEVVLGDWKKIRVQKKDAAISHASVDQTLQDLRKMQTKEIVVLRRASAADKLVVDMEMLRDGVTLEGGSTKNHTIYLSEKSYIPGLAEKLVGAAAGETRAFSLEFPKEHYQKTLSGQLVDFRVTVRDVYELTFPEIDDAFASGLGQKNVSGLRALVEKNLQAEADAKEAERCTAEALEGVVAASRFEDIPEILINGEINKMLAELERGVISQGGDFSDYLKQIKKTAADLKLGFAPDALRRVKTALAIRKISDDAGIEVSDEEVANEITRLLNMYKNDAEAQSQISSPDYADYTRVLLKNRKTVDVIRKTCVS